MSTKLSRRDFLRLAAMTGAGVALAACTPAATTVAPTTAAAEEEAPTAAPAAKTFSGELRVLGLTGAPVEPACELLTAALTAKYPDVKVKYEYSTGDHSEKVYTAAAAGNLADVFFSADLWVVPFAKNGVALDIKPLADADPEIDLSDVFENMLGLGTFDGKICMLPESLDVVTMYYNKTLFEQAGAELPTDTWTWDDFVTNTKKITEMEQDENGLPKYWGMTNSTWNWWATVYPWIVGYGGDVVDADGKSAWGKGKCLEALTAYTDLWTKHNVIQPVGLDVGGDAFLLGRAAVYTHTEAVRPTVRAAALDKFDWDAQLMPLMPDGKHRTGMGTWGLSVFADSPQSELGYEYIKLLITPAIQKLLAKKETAVPLVKSVANSTEWQEGLATPPTNLMAFVNGADDAVLPVMTYPGDCGSFYAGIVSTAYQTALESVIRGTMGAEEAFLAADEEIQACLDENAE